MKNTNVLSKYFIKEQDNRKSTLKNKFAYFVQFLREGGHYAQ